VDYATLHSSLRAACISNILSPTIQTTVNRMKNLVLAALFALCLSAPVLADDMRPFFAPDDMPTAAKLPEISAAAKQGDAVAQYKLGWMYR